MYTHFLAVLNYVSRAHAIAIRPSSAVCLWHRLSLKLLHGFLSNFSLCFPWAIYAETFFVCLFVWVFFLVFEKKMNFYKYFSFSLTWDPVGMKISKPYTFYKSQPKVFKLVLDFLPNSLQKTTFGIFTSLKIAILTNFIRFR